jgi:hypothetical protein
MNKKLIKSVVITDSEFNLAARQEGIDNLMEKYGVPLDRKLNIKEVWRMDGAGLCFFQHKAFYSWV